jgi:hypothetical protein
MSDINERIAKIKGYATVNGIGTHWSSQHQRNFDWENSIADAWPLVVELCLLGYQTTVAENVNGAVAKATRARPDEIMAGDFSGFIPSETADKAERAISLLYLAVMENDNGK